MQLLEQALKIALLILFASFAIISILMPKTIEEEPEEPEGETNTLKPGEGEYKKVGERTWEL